MLMQPQSKHVTDDPEVEQEVRDALANLGISRMGFVEINVEEGVLHLTGFTDSYAQKWLIERAASRVIGVRDIRDYLEVRPPGTAPRADAHIAQTARCALAWDARVPAGIGVQVTDGTLRLFGTVERFAQREAAEEAVRNLIGVRDVSNEIRISRDSLPTDLAGDVESAIRRRFGIACGNVWIVERNGVVTLRGSVATLELLDEIERAVKSVRGVLRVDNWLLVV